MKTITVVTILFSSLIFSRAQMQTAIPLWPAGETPGALGNSTNDIPTLTPYLCESNATGAAMVICPGGVSAPGPARRPGLRPLAQSARGDLFCAEIPARLARLPLSGGIFRRSARHALGARARRGISH